MNVPGANGLAEPRERDGVPVGGSIPADGIVRRAARLSGELRLPSDKSVAHRALIANAVSGGPASVTVRAPGEDVLSTVRCLRRLGVSVVERATDDGAIVFTVSGELGGATAGAATAGATRTAWSSGSLDCGNSGTTMRLLAGLLAGMPVGATLDGDESLLGRPMERLADPLRAMGATVETTDGHAPLRVAGSRPLRALEHRLPVASAQLLGAICLAALSADGETRVIIPGPTRDHTERLLAWMGVTIERHALPSEEHGTVTTLQGPARPMPRSLTVSGDPSAATPWLVAAAIHPDAELRLVDVGLNPSRLAAIEVLREMGADIDVIERQSEAGKDTVGQEAGPEPAGDIVVRSGRRLRGVRLGGDRVAELIDELPALGVAMAAAEGTSELRGAAELRVKESDRIAAVVAGLAAIKADVEELPDGWRVRPGAPRDAAKREATIVTGGDHRVAIAFAVAALAGVSGTVRLDDPRCVGVSYPTFWADVARVTGTANGSAR